MRHISKLMAAVLVSAACLTLAPSTNAARKATIKNCSEADHSKRLKKEKIYVAWFHASWCPTCAAQQVSIDEILKSDVEGKPFICKFDYDLTEDLQNELSVARQSTFIRYSAGVEKSRIVGKTSVEHIKRFLEGH